MKFVNVIYKALMVVLPVSVLSHMIWTAVLLANNVADRNAYMVSDLVIALCSLVWACRLLIVFSFKNPFEYIAHDSPVRIPDRLTGHEVGNAVRYSWLKKVMMIVVFIGFFGLLYSVRTNYTGMIFDGVEIHRVEHQKIQTPMLSDEWVMAGYIQDTAERRMLPNFNIFFADFGSIYNFLAPLIVSFAGFIIATGGNMFTQYWIYALLFQCFFIYTFFIFLRKSGISAIGGLLGVFMLLWLPESNLAPGIWVMLPAYMGLPFIWLAYFSLLEYRFAFAYKYKVYMMLNIIVAGLIYPPYLVLVVVYGILLQVMGLKLKIIPILLFFAALAGSLYVTLYAGHMSAGMDHVKDLLRVVWESIVRNRFVISTSELWQYVPVIFFITTLGGVFLWFRSEVVDRELKKFIATTILVLGLMLAGVYVWNIEIILSHQRVVFMCWLGMILTSMFLLDYLGRKVIRNSTTTDTLQYGVLTCFILVEVCLLTFFPYTKLVPWSGVTATDTVGEHVLDARPAVTSLFSPDMRDYLNSLMIGTTTKVLAVPYVNLAIGSMSRLQPISTVDSYISVAGYTYSEFLKLPTCEDRYSKVRELNVSYVVLYQADLFILQGCPGFVLDRQIDSLYYLYRTVVDKSRK